MLFLVAEDLLLKLMLETDVAVVFLVIFMTCLASIVPCMHWHILTPLLKVLTMLYFIFYLRMLIVIACAAAAGPLGSVVCFRNSSSTTPVVCLVPFTLAPFGLERLE